MGSNQELWSHFNEDILKLTIRVGRAILEIKRLENGARERYSPPFFSATGGIMIALLLISIFLGPLIQSANAQVAGKYSLQVNTLALNCNVRNMWVTIQSSSGAVVQSGFAPLTFLGSAGGT